MKQVEGSKRVGLLLERSRKGKGTVDHTQTGLLKERWKAGLTKIEQARVKIFWVPETVQIVKGRTEGGNPDAGWVY